MTNKKSKPSGFIDLNKKNIYNIILTIQIKVMNQKKISIIFFTHFYGKNLFYQDKIENMTSYI